ncbi:thioesterase domain-containing protein [Micromonospora profundi]|uniref:thioesterase domain-containing protein n=1 Tax=Micromonospora profundi TaxID=1420889 RepID=UPI0033A4A229
MARGDRPAAGRPQVLVVDYPGRRDAARIADLRPDSIGLDVVDLIGPRFPRECRAAAYATELLRNANVGHRPLAVFGYCMAAPIAQEVAALISTDREPVPLVLFDSRPATLTAVEDQYQAAARQLVGQLGPALDSTVALKTSLIEKAPEQAVSTMRANLTRLGAAAIMASGEDAVDAAEIAAGLSEHYLDWLIHLVAAYHCGWPSWGGAVLHLMSEHHPFTDAWPGAASTQQARFDVARVDLLHSAAVRRVLCSWLERQSTTDLNLAPEEIR